MIEVCDLKKEDLTFLLSLYNNPEIAYFEGRSVGSLTLQQQEVWFQKVIKEKNSRYYVIRYNDIRVGYISLKPSKTVFDSLHLGIRISPSHQGLGIGYDSISTLYKIVRKEGLSKRLVTHIAIHNQPSIKLFTRKLSWEYFEFDIVKEVDTVKLEMLGLQYFIE